MMRRDSRPVRHRETGDDVGTMQNVCGFPMTELRCCTSSEGAGCVIGGLSHEEIARSLGLALGRERERIICGTGSKQVHRGCGQGLDGAT